MPITPSRAANNGVTEAGARARQLVDDMRRELAGVEDQIRKLPYFAMLESGQLPLDRLASLACEQYSVITSDLRSCALLLSRHGTTAAGTFFKGILEGELAAFGLLLDFARTLGLSEEALQAYEPRAGAQAYPACVAWLAAYGSEAETAAAFLMNFPIFGESMGRISAALRTHYGLTADSTKFFDFFAMPIEGFEDDALAVIASGLQHGVQPRQIKRAARLLQAYEKLFWDTVAEAGEPAAARGHP
jgi:thiaminase